MYDLRKTSWISWLMKTLVLAMCCTVVFTCANLGDENNRTNPSDDPSEVEEPVVDPGSTDSKPLDNPTEPENKPPKEENDKANTGGSNPLTDSDKNKKNQSRKPTNSTKSNSNLPTAIGKNNKPKEDVSMDNPAPDETKELLEGAVNFIQGNMVHVIPDSMPIQEVSKVSLVIGSRENLESIKEKALELSGKKDTNQVTSAKNITIGRKMKAVLNDPKAKISPAFEITPITSEEQFVDLYNNESVDWLWNVIPLKSGAHELSMTLEVTLKNDLGESIRSIPVYNDKVKIFIPESGVPTSYETVSMPKDTTDAMAQKNSLTSEVKQDPIESGNTYMGLIVGGGVVSIGMILFLFLRKQRNNSNGSAFTKFSKAEVKELDRLQSKGDIQQALRYILERIPDHDPQRNEVELLWQNYKDNEKDNAQNLIAYEQYTQARSKISLAVITLIDEIRDLSNVKENNQPA